MFNRQLSTATRVVATLAIATFVVGACAGQANTGGPAATGAPAAPGSSVDVANASGEPVDVAPSAMPDVSGAPVQSAPPRTPGPSLPRVEPLTPPAYASRVVVPSLAIDLPVVSGDLQPPPNYPFCDVAAYVTRFSQPYETGVTYISAHAQQGMFAALLKASERADGAEMLGQPIEVYANDGRRFDYRIERVVRHAVDYAVLAELALDQRWLVLQTSEGPYGTVEKLQVIAAFQGESTVELTEANPEANPRDCEPDLTPAPSAS